MDVGQVQNLSYNQLDYYNIGVFRHGRPVNDLLDGSIDFNLFSRNEIAEMELTDGFSNFLYNFNNGINVIDRQIFQFRPYSEISYWQDRFQNLNFDGSYHQNIFKYFNFNFGITKHSYDGKYNNSDFDKWLGRFNLNYIGSKKFNSFLNVTYSKIQRGLNEGINIDTISTLEKDTLFNENAIVKNPDAYEIRERFDIDWGFILASGRNSNFLTKLQLFTSNSFRKYRDEENRPNPNGIYVKDNSQWIDYGVKFQQTFKLNLSKDINITSLTEAEYSKDLIHISLNSLDESERIFFLENLDLAVKNVHVQAYGKTYKLKYIDDKFYTDYGVKGKFTIDLNANIKLGAYIIYSNSFRLPNYQQYFLGNYLTNHKISSITSGLSLQSEYGMLITEYYNNRNTFTGNALSDETERSGLNTALSFKISKLDLAVNYQHILTFNHVTTFSLPSYINPQNSGVIALSFNDMAFKSKFEYKIGFASRFWSDYWASYYHGFYNTFDTRGKPLIILANASLDFFIIGKIDKAIFGLTLENILNRLYYTTGVYPNQSRGGLASIISRFNVTWYFLN